MEKRPIATSNAPAPAGPYTQAMLASDFVFVAGQRPANPKTGEIPSTIREQTIQCIENMEQILLAAGSSLDKIVSVHVYLSDLKNFSEMNEAYLKKFSQPYPARTTIGCSLRGIEVEIECIAMK